MLTQQSQATIQIPNNFILELEASICRDSLFQFVKMSWHIVEPDVKFVDGWHIHAICDYLEAVYENKIGDLVANIPPRHMKSLLVDVFFPAWVWTKSPSKKFICLSYAESTISEHAKKCKKLVKSQWYQERFDVSLEVSPDTDTKFVTMRGGFVYSFGFGGAYTGGGADFLLIDDPLKAADADSEAERKKVNRDYDDAVANRLNDPKTGHRILIMQRLHEGDLVGHILSKKLPFEMLILPCEYEGERFQSSTGFKDPRTEINQLLWPERFNETWLANEKLRLTERGVAGQLQQRPAPSGGFIFKKQWFKRLNDNQDVVGTYISWDTAEASKPDAAFSCGIVLELRSDYTLFPREVVRKRVQFPQLMEEMEHLALKYKDRKLKAIIIEDASSGKQAIQIHRQQSPVWLAKLIVAWTPRGDKDSRCYKAASWCERECVYLPYPSPQFPWLLDFEDEIFVTPSAEYRDQSDALSQGIDYLRNYLAQGWQSRTGNLRKPISLNGVL